MFAISVQEKKQEMSRQDWSTEEMNLSALMALFF